MPVYRPTKQEREALSFTINAVTVTLTITGASQVKALTKKYIRWPGLVEGHWFDYADPRVTIKQIDIESGTYRITAPYSAWVSRGALKNIPLEIAEQPKGDE